MDVLNLSLKSYIKIIVICLIAVIVFYTLYFFTKGGFFDGLLLTFLGLASTYTLLIVSLLIFKNLSSFLVKDKFRVLGVIVSFAITALFFVNAFIWLFKFISGELNI